MKKLLYVTIIILFSLITDIAAVTSDSFIIVVQTDKPGSSADNMFTIPTGGSVGYDYSIDCDADGSYEATGVRGSYICTYPVDNNATAKRISIDGTFPGFQCLYAGDCEKILSVEQWGTQQWLYLWQAFFGASNLVYAGRDNPDLSHVEDFGGMFSGCSSFNDDIGDWNVSNVKRMGGMFSGATIFNQDISSWDVKNVVSMSYMFYDATAFDQNIGDWNVSKVERMVSMFAGSSNFNQNIGDWDVSNVYDMSSMFEYNDNFNQNIDNWDVSTVTNMYRMFRRATAFNQNIGDWDVSRVGNMDLMFSETTVFNQDIGDWDISNVTDMNRTFENAYAFSQDIAEWDVSKVERMQYMLNNAYLSVSDYDHLLQKWQQLSLHNNVVFDAGHSRYCNELGAKNAIISQFGWTINDAGENCDFYIDVPYDVDLPSGTRVTLPLNVHSTSVNAVNYSIIGGSDAGFFGIVDNKLMSVPLDAKNRYDSNKDNIYRVRIRAKSGSYYDDRTIEVKVIDSAALVPIINYLLQ